MDQTGQPKSNRWVYILIAVVVLLLAGAAFFALQNSQTDSVGSNTEQTKTNSSTEISNPIGETPQMDREASTITYTDDGFQPKEYSVKAGTKVTVKNASSASMQFSSDDHPTHKNNEEMNMKTMNTGESATYTATKIGTWGFHNHIEDNKTGTITVTE